MNNRLYVGNLSFNTTEDAILAAFTQHGGVTQVKLIIDRETGRSRGFAFVTMDSEDSARQALSMNGVMLDGRPLRVNEAEDRRPGSGGPRNDRQAQGPSRFNNDRPARPVVENAPPRRGGDDRRSRRRRDDEDASW
jgi:RNA recognition motif-containing protein